MDQLWVVLFTALWAAWYRQIDDRMYRMLCSLSVNKNLFVVYGRLASYVHSDLELQVSRNSAVAQEMWHYTNFKMYPNLDLLIFLKCCM